MSIASLSAPWEREAGLRLPLIESRLRFASDGFAGTAHMRVLLVKTSSLGDVIHNLPVASDIRAKLPGAVTDWVAEEGFAALPRMHPAVRRVIPVCLRRWRAALGAAATWRELRAFKHALGEETYDVVLDTQGLIKSAVIARFARGRRCGYSAEAAREPLAARFYDTTFAVPKHVHAVERNRWLAAAALGYDNDLPLDYGIRAPVLTADWLPRQPFAVLLSAASRADKLWRDADWLTLGCALRKRGLVSVLPAGSPAERERAARLAAAMAEGIAAPPMALDDIAALLAGAQIVIGVDTGLTHLAAALGKPTLGIYSGSDPTLTGVAAGPSTRNIGRVGAPPSALEAIAAADTLLA